MKREMKIHEIKQAITKLSPRELADFHKWYENYISIMDKEFNFDAMSVKSNKTACDVKFGLRGKYKGKGLMKALMAEKILEKRL